MIVIIIVFRKLIFNGTTAKVEAVITEKSTHIDVESVTEKNKHFDLDEKFSGYIEKIVHGAKKIGNLTSHTHISTLTHEKEIKAIEQHNNTIRVGLGVSALVVVMVIIAIVVLMIYKFKNRNGSEAQTAHYSRQNGLAFTPSNQIQHGQLQYGQIQHGPIQVQNGNQYGIQNYNQSTQGHVQYGRTYGKSGAGNTPKRQNQIYEVVLDPILHDHPKPNLRQGLQETK